MRNAYREYQEIPALVSGYPLANYRISFYKPRAAVNLWTNPSVETDTAGYTAVGGSIAQSATRQRYGVYSLAVTPSVSATSGVYAGTVALTAGNLYFASISGYFRAGQPYKLYFANTSGTLVGTAYEFRGTGRWQRIWVGYTETSTASRRVYITKNGSVDTVPFYLDGLQVESDALTSYLDGDMRGFIQNQLAYYWVGTPHASQSVRVQATRSGGEEVMLSSYGFSVMAVVGLGLTGFSNLSTPNAYVGGAVYERTVYTERNFDIAGVFMADSDAYMRQLRSDLVNVLRPNAGIVTQPLLMRIQAVDDCDRPRGETVEVVCSLDGSSMAGSWNNSYQDPVTLSFQVYLPYMAAREGTDGAEMAYQTALGASAMFWRDSGGVWDDMNGGPGATVYAILPLPDGRILAGGSFTNAGGDANADKLAIYDPTTDTWTSLNATPLNGTVYALSLGPDGTTVYVGGNFTNAGGDANADYLCYLDLSSGGYFALNATPLSAVVYSIALMNDGTALIVGGFTNAVTADGDYIVKLGVGGAYSVLNTTPLNNTVFAVHKLPNGDAVIAGAFTSHGGIPLFTTARVQMSNGSFNTLGSTEVDLGFSLEVGLDGRVYVGRQSTDVTAALSYWTGSIAELVALNGGVNEQVMAILALKDNTIISSGVFTTAGSLTLPSRIVGWNGSSFFYMDIELTGSTYIPGLAETPDGHFIVGTSLASSGPAAAVSVLTNDGTADTHPTFIITGPGTLYQLKNYTTGDVLYFDITLLAGEQATLTLGPGTISFISTFRGNIIGSIIPGSSLSTFRLTPGDNNVSAFIGGTVDGDTALTAHWPVLYQSFDNSLYR